MQNNNTNSNTNTLFKDVRTSKEARQILEELNLIKKKKTKQY